MGVVSPEFLLVAPLLAPVPAISPSFVAPSPPLAASPLAVPPLAPIPAASPSFAARPKPFKLGVFKDAKDYLDNYDMIQFYLCIPDFSTGHSDGLLVTDLSNVEASRV
jgi:hypothetical protein